MNCLPVRSENVFMRSCAYACGAENEETVKQNKHWNFIPKLESKNINKSILYDNMSNYLKYNKKKIMEHEQCFVHMLTNYILMVFAWYCAYTESEREREIHQNGYLCVCVDRWKSVQPLWFCWAIYFFFRPSRSLVPQFFQPQQANTPCNRHTISLSNDPKRKTHC